MKATKQTENGQLLVSWFPIAKKLCRFYPHQLTPRIVNLLAFTIILSRVSELASFTMKSKL
jgi:hypothetical protein